ncbi:conserved membrane hypothetical protein [Desulfamplus magnetovallimortis]|uniref:Uncharacterized protein n=1 Tax=Desulfamplus magnetovallimortis TaxID=1246637 RepID=A0A1W1H6B5_9BACT|nr:hypothetical protein [Desulfamplus magnetovallimortis]SLM27976.1 conserved membrane hypothetical protein [Desulfamplus magnetovallimortis]
MSISAETVILIFTLFIYIIILFVFNKARKKYAGGKVGQVVNLILVTVALLFMADYATIMGKYISIEVIDTIKALFRTAGLSFLAYGGVKVAGS